MKGLRSTRVNVMVSDMHRAVAFYRDTLGLRLVEQYGEHYAEIQAENVIIGLHPRSDKTVQGNNMSIGFGVVDFDATVKTLRTAGVELREQQDGWIRLAYFHDPDKNELFIAERKEGE